MKNIKHPYDLNRPNRINKFTTRIAGFIGGGVAGLVIGAIASVVLTKFGFFSLNQAFFGIIGSIIIFAIIGTIWPKWFAQIIDLFPI